jgi:hypothetical protein
MVLNSTMAGTLATLTPSIADSFSISDGDATALLGFTYAPAILLAFAKVMNGGWWAGRRG